MIDSAGQFITVFLIFIFAFQLWCAIISIPILTVWAIVKKNKK